MSKMQQSQLTTGIIYLIAVVITQYLIGGTAGLTAGPTYNPIELMESVIAFLAIGEAFQKKDYHTTSGYIIFVVILFLVVDYIWLFNSANTYRNIIPILVIPQIIDVVWRYLLIKNNSNSM